MPPIVRYHLLMSFIYFFHTLANTGYKDQRIRYCK